MTFEQYWAILVKQWKLVVICFVLVGLGAFVGSKHMKPLYQSSVLVQVAIRLNNNQADYNSLLASDQLVETESRLATGDPVLREVAAHYSGLTTMQLSKQVTSTTETNTQLFEIDVLDPSPARAAALANDVAATLIKQQLQAIQQDNLQAQQQIQQDIDATGKQMDAIIAQISALQANGGDQAQIGILQARLSGLQQQLNQWQVALAQLELTEAQGSDFLRIAQDAQPNPIPVRPNVLLNTGVGLLVGLLLGMLLAVLFERMDTRVRTPEALAQLLGWPVLATISRARSSKTEDLFNLTGHAGNIEGYRILRTSIGFLGIDKPLHSLMVTSAAPRDGKSMISANLAIFMAKAGKTTLLIDADLHRPTQHDLFGLSADKMGLSNAVLAFSMASIPETPYRVPSIPNTPDSQQSSAPISQEVDPLTATNLSLERFVHSVGVPNLWVMPSGPLPPNPPELLDSKAMQRLLTVIANYGVEVVIFDTPPALGLSDVSILASRMDGTLVVVDVTRANKKNLKQVKGLLVQAGAHVLGCVVNKERRGRHDTTYSYYYFQSDEQDGRKKHDIGKKHAPAVPAIPVTPPRQPEMQNGRADHSTQDVNSSERGSQARPTWQQEG